MALPRIAIVGRPNVGKSSLVNMLARAKVAIVDPTPGVTRDRVSTVVELAGPSESDPVRMVEVTDTGGYGVYTAEGARYNDIGADLSLLSGDIEAQIGEAVRRADLILFVVDAQSGVMPLDETVAQLLRKARSREDAPDIPLLVVANKVDADSWEPHAAEFASLGFGAPLIISAKNNRYRRQFMEAVYEALPHVPRDQTEDVEPEMRLAIVGKRNAGKSTLVNALAGEQRVIVSEIAGATRDSVDVRFQMDGRAFLAIDTAGFRKRKSLADQIEWYATHRALRSIRRANVVVLLLDAVEDISGVDKRLAREISDNFKPCVIAVNKWDLAEGRITSKGRPVSVEDYRKYIEKEIRGLRQAPIVFISAENGRGLRDVVSVAEELHEQARQRVPTGKLNEMLREILTSRGPTSKLGTQAKVLYTAQVSTEPPTIVLVVNHAELFTPEYERYLLNRLSERTPFEEVPIRLLIRDRKRARLEDLKAGHHRARRQAEGLDPDAPMEEDQIPPRPKIPRVSQGLAPDDADLENMTDAEIARLMDLD